MSDRLSLIGPAIDVLIPVIDKDVRTLPYVIDSVRTYVMHPIRDIVIVAPESELIRAVCIQKNCKFVLEDTVLPITKQHINYRSGNLERSGWLYQQLLKLSGDTICERDFLVVDADTVFIRPLHFRIGDKYVFYWKHFSVPEYFLTYEKLLGQEKSAPRFLVTHSMFFEKSQLERLKLTIEARNGKPWYRAIIESINTEDPRAFSEYETYANFVYGQNPSKYILKPARNKLMRTDPTKISSQSVRRLAKQYRSLSFHQRHAYLLTVSVQSPDS
ncbi:DUF6492 family protein [Paenibacillus thermotolerans]|uniref:DUF6492 family protein n=1 Tax=Paenibacillus thermotolerans TaxID=3027807 RepID=UPI002368A4FE|nr:MULTISPECIES: DUF6492 family protein [unclassified Paenibacillus]